MDHLDHLDASAKIGTSILHQHPSKYLMPGPTEDFPSKLIVELCLVLWLLLTFFKAPLIQHHHYLSAE